MTSFTQIRNAVGRAIDTGQLGTPVAARLVLHETNDSGQIEARLGRALATVGRWFDRSISSIAAQGGTAEGQISTLARYDQGRVALVSCGDRGAGAPLVELLLFGSKGVLSWEGGQAGHGEEAADQAGDGDRIGQLVQISLDRGEPVAENASSSGRAKVKRLQQVNLASPAAPTEAQTPPYGVLLVSGDYTHQPNYATDLAADPRCRLIGVTDEADLPERRRALNQQFAERMGIPLLRDLESALQREDVDVVSLCAEPYRRGPIAIAAARAGKHLYFDKPLAPTMATADGMVAAVREAGVLGHMMTMVLNEPAQTARRIARSGRLGELVAIHCDISFAKGQAGTADLSNPRRESPNPERFEVAESKREMTNTGVYPLAMLHWILGRRVNRVTAATGNFFFAEHQANDMEDFGQILMEFDGGLTASVTAGRVGWRSHPGFGVHRVCLIGNEATAVVDSQRPRVEIWADVEPWTAPQRDPGDPMGMWNALPDSPYQAGAKESWITPHGNTSDARHFLDCLEQGVPTEMPVDIGAAATEVLLAAYQSAASGQTVELA